MTATATAPKRLWEIADELGEIEALVAENEGVLTPDLEARLDALEGTFESRVESIALMAREAKLDAEKAKAEKDRMAAAQKRNEATVAWAKKYLHECLIKAGTRRVETHRATVRIQKSGTPSIDYAGDVMELPRQFVRVIPESVTVDKAALTEVVRAKGEIPEGVVVTYSESVVIV
ncbi:MAG: siphovirus Gp157 family protein [Vicinamibacterales bacterium]